MARQRLPRPIRVHLDGEPPAELLAAAARGECLLVTGERPDPAKVANVVARVIDQELSRASAANEKAGEVIEPLRQPTKI